MHELLRLVHGSVTAKARGGAADKSCCLIYPCYRNGISLAQENCYRNRSCKGEYLRYKHPGVPGVISLVLCPRRWVGPSSGGAVCLSVSAALPDSGFHTAVSGVPWLDHQYVRLSPATLNQVQGRCGRRRSLCHPAPLTLLLQESHHWGEEVVIGHHKRIHLFQQSQLLIRLEP